MLIKWKCTINDTFRFRVKSFPDKAANSSFATRTETNINNYLTITR